LCRFLYHEVALQPRLEDGELNQDSTLKLYLKYQSSTDGVLNLEVIDFSLKSKIFEFYERSGKQ